MRRRRPEDAVAGNPFLAAAGRRFNIVTKFIVLFQCTAQSPGNPV
jgi:hypothetical protein